MMIRKMGPIGKLLGMLPGMGQMKDALADVDDRDIDRTAAIIRVDDAGRAARPEDHQRLPPAAHRHAAPGRRSPTSTSWSTGSSRPAR